MKVIHVAGWSNSGKTTFILDLVAALASQGKVGTIKHIGDHYCELPPGKDTSRHYEAGAGITIGIDLEKTMITNRTTSLSSALDQLSDLGVRYVVIEGFKKIPFQKVVLGDLDTPALIRNPEVSKVLSLLSEFDDYYTLTGLIREIEEHEGAGVLTLMSGALITPLSHQQCASLEAEVSGWEGISGIRIRIQKPVVQERPQLLMVVRARTGELGISTLNRCRMALSL